MNAAISETNSGTGVTSYPLTDGLGSTTGLANSAGFLAFGRFPSRDAVTL